MQFYFSLNTNQQCPFMFYQYQNIHFRAIRVAAVS